MSLWKVIQRHYSTFCREVNPVELASCLNDLTMTDRETIACKYRSDGRLIANMELCSVICSKVDWKDLYEVLMRENYRRLAKILYEEYYKQNPTAERIVYKEPLESQVAEGDTKHMEFIPDASSSNEKTSSKIHLKGKINGSSSSCKKDSTTSKSQSLVPIANNYTYNISNSNVQIGDQNKITSKYDKPEESVEDDDTTYEYEVVPEVLENQSSSEIDNERSPDPQNISGGQLVEQSIADDAYRTNNLLSYNSISRSAVCGRIDSNGNSQTLQKASVTSEIECSQRIEKATSNYNSLSYSTSNIKILGVDLRHNGHSEGENRADDGEDETCLKEIMSND